jgi:hypothetical protein
MKNKTDQIQWGKFAGLASHWAIALTLFIFLGKYIDQKIGRVSPLFLWISPSFFIVFSLFKIIRDTQLKSKK